MLLFPDPLGIQLIHPESLLPLYKKSLLLHLTSPCGALRGTQGDSDSSDHSLFLNSLHKRLAWCKIPPKGLWGCSNMGTIFELQATGQQCDVDHVCPHGELPPGAAGGQRGGEGAPLRRGCVCVWAVGRPWAGRSCLMGVRLTERLYKDVLSCL